MNKDLQFVRFMIEKKTKIVQFFASVTLFFNNG